MTTAPRGFRTAATAAGVIVLILNDGPLDAAAAVFGPADPSPWSEQVVGDGRVRAAVLCPAGLGSATGPDGFAVTHRTAEQVAAGLTAAGTQTSSGDVVVCSTGPAAPRLGEPVLRAGIGTVLAGLTDGSDPRLATVRTAARGSPAGWVVGGLSCAACVVLTTDAVLGPAECTAVLSRVEPATGTLLLMASGAGGAAPDRVEFAAVLADLRRDLSEPAFVRT